ncbi:hypothetical protein GCM10023194_77240 [Planotetraspora phitsanulokensis]|uniref:Uncharacterized protein n=1 Tax=Planotetraspora phitsanulokensis TaxID=575192 RepID=A0A8J3XGG9_9ACTN|nr:hypothetical protein Pph01_05410 [Planotetraspora phitsanulokensis]
MYSAEGAGDTAADETRRVHVLGTGTGTGTSTGSGSGSGSGDTPPDFGNPRRTVHGDAVQDTRRTETSRMETTSTDTDGKDTTDTVENDPLDRHGSENADSRETSETSDARDDILAPDLVRTGDPGTPPVAGDPDVLVAGPAARERATVDDPEPVDDVDFERSWHEIKAGFVDDPRGSVEQADGLVEAAVAVYASRRQALLDQWKNSDQADTEALRLALREYHTLLAQLTGK